MSPQEAAPSVRDALQAAADSGDFERFRELLREVLDAQEALAGANMAEDNAIKNYSGDKSAYTDAAIKALERVSAAEKAARAALSKQEAATPAPQEPAEPVAPKVYLVATGEVYEGRETYTRHDVCPPLADAELLYRWLPTYNPDATQPVADAQDARRYRYLESIAYEAVIPHGGKLNGYRTAWITKFVPQPHATFAEAVDAAIDAAMALDVTKRDPNGKE
jgi:hypothetical protein